MVLLFKFIQRASSIQSLSRVWLFVTPWTAARQVSLSITNSQSLLKLMFIELVMPSNHLILCHPLLPLPSIFPSIRVFSKHNTILFTIGTVCTIDLYNYSSCITENPIPVKQQLSIALLPPAPCDFLFLSTWLFQIPHISGIIQHLSFCEGLILLSITVSRFIHVVAGGRISFFFKTE